MVLRFMFRRVAHHLRVLSYSINVKASFLSNFFADVPEQKLDLLRLTARSMTKPCAGSSQIVWSDVLQSACFSPTAYDASVTRLRAIADNSERRFDTGTCQIIS